MCGYKLRALTNVERIVRSSDLQSEILDPVLKATAGAECPVQAESRYISWKFQW